MRNFGKTEMVREKLREAKKTTIIVYSHNLCMIDDAIVDALRNGNDVVIDQPTRIWYKEVS